MAFRPHKKVENLVLVLFQKLIYISFKCHRLDINISFSFQMGALQPYFTQKFALNSHFTLKFAVFCAITRKPLVRKCCKWSQKMLLGPLSTLDKSNMTGPFGPQIGTKSRAKLMEIRRIIYLQSTKKNLRTSF